MDPSLTHQTIALAGLAQSVHLVQQIAQRGRADDEAMAPVIGSVLMVDAENIEAVYGGLVGLKLGFRTLIQQLSEPRQVDPELARYASTLLFLERELLKRPPMIEVMGAAILEAVQARDDTGTLLDGQVLAAMARGYLATISTLKPKVIVSGEQRFLAEAHHADRIRALLLAGIRSALLWRQAGGSRWKILFIRGRIRSEAERLLKGS
ncbi:MAG: high frequency lysogenization protein HflD [Methylococcaceae bacterium]|jgi:high frequency lysogenization protein